MQATVDLHPRVASRALFLYSSDPSSPSCVPDTSAVLRAATSRRPSLSSRTVRVGGMGREVVTGYCWPQSVRGGEQVGLHMSSSGGRSVRVEVARVGARREVVFRSDQIAAD